MSKSDRVAVDGVLLLDKPLGLSSNKALQIVKRLYKAKKAGHTGSLDPLATGMLPICFGEATKFSQFLLNADKVYQVTAKLGQQTTTGDAEGEIINEKSVDAVTKETVEAILTELTGDIMQIPPMYSALKHQGQPLYKLARQGVEIKRKARPVTIYQLSMLDYADSVLSFEVHCSKGTYVRSLVEDIGDKLGCGAHVTVLRRISVSDYSIDTMITLDQLRELKDREELSVMQGLLLPIDTPLQHFPVIALTDSLAGYIKQGQSVFVANAPTEGLVKLMHNEQFIGVGQIQEDGCVRAKRLCQT